jgi:hypothetical protein
MLSLTVPHHYETGEPQKCRKNVIIHPIAKEPFKGSDPPDYLAPLCFPSFLLKSAGSYMVKWRSLSYVD